MSLPVRLLLMSTILVLAGVGPRNTPAGAATWVEEPPLASYGNIAAYDALRHRWLYFGREGTKPETTAVWSFDPVGRSWSQVQAIGPAPPVGHARGSAIYDRRHDQVVILSGGSSTDAGEIATLSLSGTPTWRVLGPSGSDYAQAYTYDSRRGAVLRYGGEIGTISTSAEGGTSETDYGGAAPVPLTLPLAGADPGLRGLATLAYDSTADRAVLFSGMTGVYDQLSLTDDTWELVFSDSARWELEPATGPVGRFGAAIAFDDRSERLLMFGGVNQGALGDAWQWHMTGARAGTWRLLFDGNSPGGPRFLGQAAVDTTLDEVFVGGGQTLGVSSTIYNDVWAHGLESTAPWTLLTPGSTPAGYVWPNAVYDSLADRLLVFPEGVPMAPFVLHDGAWSVLPAVGPTPRSGFTTVLDEVGGRIIVFGGQTPAGTNLNDAWALYLADPPYWQQLGVPGTTPPARAYHAAVLDVPRHRMIIFGGNAGSYASPRLLNDTWALSLDDLTWTQLIASPVPAPRQHPVAAFDPVRERMIVAGGGYYGATSSDQRDTWALSLTGVPGWTQIGTSGSIPYVFDTCVYDPVQDELIVAAGDSPTQEGHQGAAVLPLASGSSWAMLSSSVRSLS